MAPTVVPAPAPDPAATMAHVGRMPRWLRLSLRLVRAHGRRYYDFDALDRFKATFEPQEWELRWRRDKLVA